ncbi:type II toxin-antitoxin system VapC family toxin [uncultured Jannaschia sp.]|uniref:type II toxin-antitoxin system VapC family toxin n=1 Tax=uncultured Jannaschia sp. TaxID=293347 RepID=UPI00260DC1D6|nr:type II toxin-antitoxin system VapC family toxin [uncultured Jannaschia sp.]
MTSVVLDASAVLAFVKGETGGEAVLPYVGDAAISAVNLQEVVKELLRDGLEVEIVREIVDGLRLAVHDHDAAAAYAAAGLHAQTERYGRGLGDRTCMALGLSLGLPVLTADREWRRVEVEGLALEHIR